MRERERNRETERPKRSQGRERRQAKEKEWYNRTREEEKGNKSRATKLREGRQTKKASLLVGLFILRCEYVAALSGTGIVVSLLHVRHACVIHNLLVMWPQPLRLHSVSSRSDTH